MPLCRIVLGLTSRSIKLTLNNILVYQYVVFNRKYGSNKLINNKGLIFRPEKEDSVKSVSEFFKYFLAETVSYEKKLSKEVLEELDLQILSHDMKYFFTKDISQFKHFGIELDREKLVLNLLKHLDDFPFDMTPIYYFQKSRRESINIRVILSVIEAQYLSHKLNIDFKLIRMFLREMKSCIFYYKSMRSVKRNLDALLKDKCFREMNISNIILFLNILRPFSVTELKNIQENLLGISWDKVVSACPFLVKNSYQGIMLRINFLRCLGFTDEQIRLALPNLGTQMITIHQNIEYILKEFGSYKNDQLFLRLLSTCFNRKRRLRDMNWKTYDALQKAIALKQEKKQSLSKSRKVICYLQENLGLTKREWKIIRDHPASIVHNRVLGSLNFLKEKGFTKNEILESIPVILYPQNVIEKGLQKVNEEVENLKKVGFKNGCVKKNTTYFAKGTREKRKTLQLCLYYIEKSIYVSDDIILDFDTVKVETENQNLKIQADE